MSINQLNESIKDYGKDIRLNLSSVLTEEGAPGLTREQIWGVALACAYATRQSATFHAIQTDAAEKINPATIQAAKSAATIMAMNNVYYRSLHLADDKVFSTIPARLRMSIIGKPGIDKTDFELMCLAVSAIAGCGSCINAHIKEAQKASVSNEGIQSALRIASVMNAVAQALFID